MRLKIFLVFSFLFCAVALQAQRSKYFTYLSEKFALYNTINPSIYAAKDGGFFLADNSVDNAVRLTKFNAFGNIVWQEQYTFLTDGMDFISLEETNEGNIVLLVETSWARNMDDAVYFILNSQGKEIYNSFVIPIKPKDNNFPIKFYLFGDTMVVFGSMHRYRRTLSNCFISYANIKTKEEITFKTLPFPNLPYSPIDIIHYSPHKVIFTITIGDTVKSTQTLGILTYYPKQDTFSIVSLTEKLGKMNVDSTIKLNSINEFRFGITQYNSFDSSVTLTYNDYSNECTYLLNFDSQGNLKKQKKLLRTPNCCSEHFIYQITSREPNKSKLLMSQPDKDSLENKLYLVDIDNNLNLSNHIIFFTETAAFKAFADKNLLKYEYSTSERWAFNSNYLIYDKQGDLIFCALMYHKDSSRIFLIKLTSNGEAVTLSPASAYNEDKFIIYPNPSKELITINLPLNDDYLIDIYDVNGKLVLKDKGTGYYNLNISFLSPGSYFVKLTNSTTNVTKTKILIKQP